jgi:hypothetical protein
MSTVSTDSGPTIAEMNYVIGVFDGRGFNMSHITDYTAANAPKMKYHTDWNRLMRVGKKIRDVLSEMQKKRPLHTACQGDLIEVDIHCAVSDYDIVNVHKHMFTFITWYNQQKQTNE